MKQRAKPVMG